MSGCTLVLARNCPHRTTLVDETTGHVKYQIDTPKKLAGGVTRIRKFDSPTQPPPHLDEDNDCDSSEDIADKDKPKSKEDKENEEGEPEPELPGTDDEIARIYWKWFSPDRIIFRGGITTRDEFLPKVGKMKG